MSMFSLSLRIGADGGERARYPAQCLSVRITLVRNTDSLRLS